MSNTKFFALITHIWLLGFAITKESSLAVMAIVYVFFTFYCFCKEQKYDQRTH